MRSWYCPRCRQTTGHVEVEPADHGLEGCVKALAGQLQWAHDRINEMERTQRNKEAHR